MATHPAHHPGQRPSRRLIPGNTTVTSHDPTPATTAIQARTALALLGVPGTDEMPTSVLMAAARRARDAAHQADMTALDVARLLRMPRQAVEALCQAGTITAYPDPTTGQWRITTTALETFRHNLATGTSDAPRILKAAGMAGEKKPHRRRRRGRRGQGHRNRTTSPALAGAGDEETPAPATGVGV